MFGCKWIVSNNVNHKEKVIISHTFILNIYLNNRQSCGCTRENAIMLANKITHNHVDEQEEIQSCG